MKHEQPSPGNLVTVLAKALNLPIGTVAQVDRRLAEAGLRSKSGRGRSAARVTAIDASNLLLAILGAPVVGSAINDAPKTCRKYSELPAAPKPDKVQAFRRIGLPSIARLPLEHTLGQALSSVILAAALGEKPQRPEKTYHSPLILRVWGPSPTAALAGPPPADPEDSEPRITYQLPRNNSEPINQDGGDLIQFRVVSYHTIAALASVVDRKGMHQSEAATGDADNG